MMSKNIQSVRGVLLAACVVWVGCGAVAPQGGPGGKAEHGGYHAPTTDDWITAVSAFWRDGKFLYDEFETCPCMRPANPAQPPGWDKVPINYSGPNPEVCIASRATATILNYDGEPLANARVRLDFLLSQNRSSVLCLPMWQCDKGLEDGTYKSEGDQAYRDCTWAASAVCEDAGIDDLCRVPDFTTDAAGSFSVETAMIGTAMVQVAHPESKHLIRGQFGVDQTGGSVTLRVSRELLPEELKTAKSDDYMWSLEVAR